MVRTRLVVCALALAAGATADARPGKVVRVERQSMNSGVARVCTLTISDPALGAAGMTTYCFGPSVRVGERIVAVSDDGRGVTLAVQSVTAYPGQQCLDPQTIWVITPELVE